MMRSKLTHRPFTLAKPFIFILAAVVLISVAIHAPGSMRPLTPDEVSFSGFTGGCFGQDCTPGCSNTYLGLTFNGATFSGTSADGVRGLGGNPSPEANINNLGSFSLSADAHEYSSAQFSLQVTFTRPEGINASNTERFIADVEGTVRANDDGGVIIDFSNSSLVFTFRHHCTDAEDSTTCTAGSFTFMVNDLAVDPGQTASITGQIIGAQQLLVTTPKSTTPTPSPTPTPDADGDGDPDITDCALCNGAIHHGAPEVCDGVDNNCNGQVDEGVKNIFYRDADNDGYGNPFDPIQACSAPAGYVANNTDCNDSNSGVNPGAPEVCNGADDNCNGQRDEGLTDTDSDGQADCVDSDDDNDSVPDNTDKCPLVSNPLQIDIDGDGIGDECDAQVGPPENKNQCINEKWRLFKFPRRFQNQGDCIQFVNTGR